MSDALALADAVEFFGVKAGEAFRAESERYRTGRSAGYLVSDIAEILYINILPNDFGKTR